MTHGILSGTRIKAEIEGGGIEIDPYNPNHLNPTSYDLTLGTGVLVYNNAVIIPARVPGEPNGAQLFPKSLDFGHYLDAAKENEVQPLRMGDAGFLLKPGIGYLMHTVERVRTDSFCPILDGKSSIGRLFIKVHETAGFGDAGFDGQYTLEVTAVYPVLIYPGMRICQIRFQTIVGKPELYTAHGHYTGANASGAVASKSYLQMKEQKQ